MQKWSPIAFILLYLLLPSSKRQGWQISSLATIIGEHCHTYIETASIERNRDVLFTSHKVSDTEQSQAGIANRADSIKYSNLDPLINSISKMDCLSNNEWIETDSRGTVQS